MRDQAIRTSDQDDAAGNQAGGVRRTDFEDVARQHGRRHAQALYAQPNATETGQHFFDEKWTGGFKGSQEFLRTRLHWGMVGLILPQARAVVSNTSSRVNDGFT